jgi:RHS repeat-associated protein
MTTQSNSIVSSTFSPSYTFTGQEADTGGFINFGPRLYDPTLGQFLQADSIIPDVGDPQALNPYAYARNNPIHFTDPSGHSFVSALMGAVFGLGVALVTGNVMLGAFAGGMIAGMISASEQGAGWGVFLAGLAGGTMASAGAGFGAAFPMVGALMTGASMGMSLYHRQWGDMAGAMAGSLLGYYISSIAPTKSFGAEDLGGGTQPPPAAVIGRDPLPKDRAIVALANTALDDGATLVDWGKDYTIMMRENVLVIAAHSDGDILVIDGKRLTPSQVGNMVQELGLRPKSFELLACGTARPALAKFAKGFSNKLGIPGYGALNYVSGETMLGGYAQVWKYGFWTGRAWVVKDAYPRGEGWRAVYPSSWSRLDRFFYDMPPAPH